MKQATVIAVGVLAALLLGGVPAAAGAGRTYFPQGQSPADIAYRPRTLLVAGEGSFIVQQMRWRSWGRAAARGRGIGAQDDCVPGCADGTFHRAPVRIRLWRPRRRCGHRIWTRMTLIWTDGPPAGIPGYDKRREIWPLGVFPCEASDRARGAAALASAVRGCGDSHRVSTLATILSVRNMSCQGAERVLRRGHFRQNTPIGLHAKAWIGGFRCHVYEDDTPPGPSDVDELLRCARGTRAFRYRYAV